nr:putative transcriptional regulatory protein [Quercus suber]
MQETVKRTPRACERCRQSRRRCLPPYPCRQCVAAGVPCDVRDKARPQRRQLLRKISPNQDDDRNNPDVAPTRQPRFRTASVSGSRPPLDDAEHPPARDTFTLLKSLVQDMLSERHGNEDTSFCSVSD